MQNSPNSVKTILLIEPYYAGSHQQLVDLLFNHYAEHAELITLPGTKWHWRARTGALSLAQQIPKHHNYSALFCSSVLNLAELIALRPDLSTVRKVVYFHENQLVYPIRKQKDRDFQYGYNQILSCLVADRVAFNSIYNQQSFLVRITPFLNQMPKPVPTGVRETIEKKCTLVYFPIELHSTPGNLEIPSEHSQILQRSLTILWPHRWEHDKNPEQFFNILFKLNDANLPFALIVMGQSYQEIPTIFTEAKARLSDRIQQWGFVESRLDYFKLLAQADVVVSTAIHEFFGVAMLEAVHCGALPLCPKRLVYPEIFPPGCLYNTENQLLKTLKSFCLRPNTAREQRSKLDIDWNKYSWSTLQKKFDDLLL